MLNVRNQFPIFRHHPELVYCDTAATAQKPQVVIDAVRDFYERDNANIHRGLYELSLRASERVEAARAGIAAFIAAKTPDEIVFVRNATEAINLFAYAWARNTLKKGDEIVLTEMEHHANIVPWQQVAAVTGATIKYIRLTADFHLDFAHASELITDRTKLVALTHASNVLGTVNDVKAIATLAKQHGALVLVDAAQSVPHITVDVKELGCDALVFSGHKLYGPTGVGVLWARSELLRAMPPFLTGGDMIEHVTKESALFAPPPRKFEAGTPDISGIVGLGAAVQWVRSYGFAAIEEHEREISEYALGKFLQIPGLNIVGPKDVTKRLATFAFTMNGIHPHDLASLLNDHHVAIRAGYHCAEPLATALGVNATARASFGIYSTTEDVDQLATALEKICAMFQIV